MTPALIKCHEEEFAPFFAYAWRRAGGWRPDFVYARGMTGVSTISGLLLSGLGLWRFVRVPEKLLDHQSDYVGLCVTETATSLGSYGMGGPGFCGFRFQNGWIVYRLWGAACWLTLNGKLIDESLFPDEKKRYRRDGLASIDHLKGSTLRAVACGDEQYDLTFEDAGQSLLLSIRRDGSTVPRWRGNGRPKALAENETLEDAIVVSRKGSLWLID